MKKSILTTAFTISILFANAQFKVFSTGKISLGSTTTPNQSLDVTGDISLVSSTNAFRINNNQVLWNNGNTNDIFVGYNAGNASMTGHNHTLVGNNAGNATTTGISNAAFGYQALKANTSGSYNVAVGGNALVTATTYSYNTACGYNSLNANTSSFNSAFGYSALKVNTSGANSAFGYLALSANTTGYYNNAFGNSALLSNVTGNGNCAFGDNALSLNTASYNSAFGYNALNANSSGLYNTAFGAYALSSALTVHENTAVGYQSLQNAIGGLNTAVGYQSSRYTTTGTNNVSVGYAPLYNATTGSSNTAIGGNVVGSVLTTGSNNTLIGYGANVAAACSTLTNMTALGNGAIATAANDITLGNTSIATIHANVTTITAISDGRFKTNVTENVKGLEFIKKLRPVTYNLNTEALDDFIIQNMPDSIKTIHKQGMDFVPSKTVVHSGFIAQEVEEAAQQVGFNSSIVYHPSHKTDPYGLGYAEFVVPLVKAVQELSKTADSLTTLTHKQDSINKALQNQINQIVNKTGARTNNNSGSGENKGVGSINVELNNSDVVVLNEAVPNPFAEQTVITFNIPTNYNTAQMLFYDSNGKLIKSVDIKTAGKGQLNVFANDLSNGTYSYTLVVDGKIIATKRMIRQQ